MAENYGFEATILRFVEIGRFCAENRSKSMPEIWKRTRNVVPLHCQSEDRRALKMRDTQAGCRPPDVVGRNDSNTM